MSRVVALLVGGFCLAASAGAPEGSGPKAPAATVSPKQKAPASTVAPKEPSSKFVVTLENLDRYLRYRQESDAATISAAQAMAQASNESVTFMSQLQKMSQADQAVREKHGLGGEDFQQLDRMVRDVSNSRFMPESTMLKATLKMNEQRAAAEPKGPLHDMAKAMAAMVRKQMETGPQLREQRAEYGDTNVDLILSRESALKALWLRTDAEVTKMFEELGRAPPETISL